MNNCNEKIDDEIEPYFDINKFGEYFLPSVNRNAFEKVDSETYYNLNFNIDLDKEDFIFIFVGSDSGLLANYLLNKKLGKGSKIIIFELEHVLSLLNVDIPSDRSKDFYLISYDCFFELNETVELNLHVIRKCIEIYKSSAVKSGVITSYNALYSNVDNRISTMYFELKALLSSQIYIKCQFENLCENILPSSILKDKFDGCTAVVIGGGPSLDNHIDWLLENRDKCILIVASRVYAKLYNLGIKADFVVSIDPYAISFEVNKDFMSIPHETILINGYHTTPLIMGQWTGAKLYLGNLTPFNRHNKYKNNILQKPPTVINSAIEFAVQLGVKRVLLMGVDFCHSKMGKTHTDNTHGSNSIPDFSKSYDWVKTYNGDYSETPPQLNLAIKSLESNIKNYQSVDIINSSLDAAVVEGVRYSNPIDLDIVGINSIHKKILSPKSYIPSDSECIEHIDLCTEILKTELLDVKKLCDILSDAVSLIDELRSDPNNSSVINYKLDNIELEIESNYSDIANLCKEWGKYDFINFMTSRNDDVEWNQTEITDRFSSYYKTYLDSANAIMKLMEDSLDRCLSRRMEFDGIQYFDDFFAQWKKDQQFARVRVFSQIQSINISLLADNVRDKIFYAEKLFQEQLKATPKKIDNVNFLEDMISRSFLKISLLFSVRNINALHAMVQYTHPYINLDKDVMRLHFNAKSYCSFLTEDYKQSLEDILEIPDDLRTELERKHIVHLSLLMGLLDIAIENLGVLSSIHDGYLPKYAKLLSLSGEYQLAIINYVKYLELYPDHVGCLLDFGSFLLRLNEFELARDCFNKVIEIEPNNLTVKNYFDKI